ncbi:3-hydroxyacyl-ACP dehydratase FabZ [Brachyspira pilosicoli]|uniref:3-hydroxyacyl-[acyl-carrier-protein] dehydratase FabZ n=4 Tax=Brachyspira pilosicoli TaxID=52584 RepID=D8IC98_BRAP9|nr:3-hydroxyacyl-ACP dehydratase FabZ [Brachyspira pilosicoli]ADK30771.1 (3R)-hydroxymyristoyl-(acyl carrier protein) dehydratase [Brachyspira pilosicoli 95/1000]AGA67410.1 (3R)-hydroxymyristoyl-(acyl carrier protein) dehydratase [Brachyspira pilosicoli P43/6/78]MBW5377101.1 3-hydroxyacyl-ACP dehydratase FabZ [Brachyspira pilosicoli]MBW5382961.1 3-hydroxyacyl-ACP dehydratase FabZ [Brachyspira pilosicoli]MBW5391809.1 3-hydroxyacyl-ACP dehydratase FabZ [Brachyspira pilosicoli]
MENINITKIMELLPHRYPFLLVDKVISIEEGKIHSLKNVTFNEPQFTGHFPESPIMPGVLMVEALAQTSGIYCYMKLLKPEEIGNKFMFFAKIDNVKFKNPVIPGDVMDMFVTVEAFNGTLLKTHGEVRVGDSLACSADLGLFLVDREAMKINK